MARSKWEGKLHGLTLALCFGLPLLHQIVPDYAPLVAVLAFSLLLWVTTLRSEDPFLSTRLVTLITVAIFANAIAYGFSSAPAAPMPSVTSLLACIVYLGVLAVPLAKAAKRVCDIDLEYFRYSLPSKRLSVDMGRRTGRLDQKEAAFRLQLFVKEGLQFRRLSKACRLLMAQTWGGLILFLVLGLREPWHLLVFLTTTTVIAACASSIAARATLHPGEPLPLQDIEEDDDEDYF